MLYHGTQQDRQKLVKNINKRNGTLQIHPVLITSFEIAMRDRNALQVRLVFIGFFVIHKSPFYNTFSYPIALIFFF